jgi:hypothetical protein
MALTSAQYATIKADIAANSDLNTKPNTPDGNFEVARLYNLLASPDFYVWRTEVAVQEIYNQINWVNLTPVDAVPDATVTTGTALTYLNRAMVCQAKQFNLQTLLLGQGTINAARSNVRAGLQDALSNYPSGVNGALIGGNWVAVRDNALARKATRLEKLLSAGGTGANAQNASTMGFEGGISPDDVTTARNS